MQGTQTIYAVSRLDRLIRYVVAAFIFIALLAFGDNPLAQTAEYQVKAAFLYKFAGYIQWPADVFISDGSPIVFGILGADQLAGSLEQIIKDRKINGRALEVRRLQAGAPIQGLHVLFVGEGTITSIESSLPDMVAGSVLTVTEMAHRPSGSVINFEIIDDKVRFDVSLESADQAGLQISSRLLQVAYKVIDGQI